MNRRIRIAAGTAAALLGGLALAGCGGSHGQAMPGTVTEADRRAVSFHSATGHYSARQVERAFAAHGVRLRDVSPNGYRRTLALLDGRPAQAVYVYVTLGSCKCLFKAPIRHARVTRHGNVEVLWRRPAGAAVRAALRELH
jgi:hypothetical protein